ncbi:MAG TPA: hypothetical protein VGD99_17935 [Anaerolineae bacterium]|jgi:hypothetical protein
MGRIASKNNVIDTSRLKPGPFYGLKDRVGLQPGVVKINYKSLKKFIDTLVQDDPKITGVMNGFIANRIIPMRPGNAMRLRIAAGGN